MLFDTHTHLNVDTFQSDRQEVIERARFAGVKGFGVVGFDYPTIKMAQQLAEKNKDMVTIIGWHPTEAAYFNQQAEQYLQQQLDAPWVVGLGETGLDYYWHTSSPDVQEKTLRRQLAIARERHLPVIIHDREATADCYRILKDENVQDFGGIMHSFSEGSEWAKKFLDLGMHLSFSGTVTYSNAEDIQAACKLVPGGRLLIETDSPYLAPQPKRGLRNESTFVYHVAQKVAQLREQSTTEIAQQTFNNACQLFQLKATPYGFYRRGNDE